MRELACVPADVGGLTAAANASHVPPPVKLTVCATPELALSDLPFRPVLLRVVRPLGVAVAHGGDGILAESVDAVVRTQPDSDRWPPEPVPLFCASTKFVASTPLHSSTRSFKNDPTLVVPPPETVHDWVMVAWLALAVRLEERGPAVRAADDPSHFVNVQFEPLRLTALGVFGRSGAAGQPARRHSLLPACM